MTAPAGLDAALGALRRVVEAGDPPLAAWVEAAVHTRRLGRPPPFLRRDRDLARVRAALAAHPGERALAGLALALAGLAPPEAEAGEVDPASGLPRRARSRRGGVELRWVPGGEVLLPAPPGREPFRDRVEGFYLGRLPVTAAEWGGYQEVLGPAAMAPPDLDEQRAVAGRPVVQVDWHDAQGFAAWAGGRLPRDVEWLRAAQGGTLRRFPWGDEEPAPARASASFDAAARPGEWRTRLGPAGTRPEGRGPFGHHDLAGGVQEWCEDWFGNHVNPWKPGRFRGPSKGVLKVVRGGCWAQPPAALDLYRGSRRGHMPGRRYPYVGFRLCVPM